MPGCDDRHLYKMLHYQALRAASRSQRSPFEKYAARLLKNTENYRFSLPQLLAGTHLRPGVIAGGGLCRVCTGAAADEKGRLFWSAGSFMSA